METIKTLLMRILPTPGSSNVTFMEIKFGAQSFTAILTKNDAIALQASGLLNQNFSEVQTTVDALHG